MYKDNKFLSEIGNFFKENSDNIAMATIMRMMHNVNLIHVYYSGI